MTTMDPDLSTKKRAKAAVDKVCATCQFWFNPHFGQGTCKAGPPTPGTVPGHSSWPMTPGTEFCWAHRPSAAAIEEANARLEAEGHE